MDHSTTFSVTEDQATVASWVMGVVLDYFATLQHCTHFCRRDHSPLPRHLTHCMRQEQDFLAGSTLHFLTNQSLLTPTGKRNA